MFPNGDKADLRLYPESLTPFTLTRSTFDRRIMSASLSVLIAQVPILGNKVFRFNPFVHCSFSSDHVGLILVTRQNNAAFGMASVNFVVHRGRYAFRLSNVNHVSARVNEGLRQAARTFQSVSGQAIQGRHQVRYNGRVVAVASRTSRVFLSRVKVVLSNFTREARSGTLLDGHLLRYYLCKSTIRRYVSHRPTGLHAFIREGARFIRDLRRFQVSLVRTLQTFLLLQDNVMSSVLVISQQSVRIEPYQRLRYLPVTRNFRTRLGRPFQFVLLNKGGAGDLFVRSTVGRLHVCVNGRSMLVVANHRLV